MRDRAPVQAPKPPRLGTPGVGDGRAISWGRGPQGGGALTQNLNYNVSHGFSANGTVTANYGPNGGLPTSIDIASTTFDSAGNFVRNGSYTISGAENIQNFTNDYGTFGSLADT